MDDLTAAVLAVFQSGGQFDPTLTSRLTGSQAEIANVVASLNSYSAALVAAGIGNLPGELANYDPGAELPQLSTHVSSTSLPNLFQNIDIFQSTTAISGATPQDLSAAFGPLFSARNFSSACDAIYAALPTLSSDTTGDVAANLTDRVNELVALPGSVQATIVAEQNFYSASSQTLTQYSQSLQAIQTYSDYTFRAIIGAVASDELLGLVKPSDSLPTPPPLPPPPPPLPPVPPNQDADPVP